MIITNEGLRKFINIDSIKWEDLVVALSHIGLEVESEVSTSVPKDVVVAKILKRTQHPNADKLSVCEVDIGTEVLQIVCGAKNVYVGQHVALARVGAELPFGREGKTRIELSKIRDIESHGMICSSSELGLIKFNDGIMELDSSIGELILGKPLCEYEVFNQKVLELGITPNRGDCLSVLGISRDIASTFNLIVKNIVPSEPSVALGVGRFFQVVPYGDIQSSLMYRLAEFKEAYTPLAISIMLGITGKYKENPLENFMEYTTYMTGVLCNCYAMDSKLISSNGSEAKFALKVDESGLESVYAEISPELHNKLSRIGLDSSIIDGNNYPRIIVLETSFIDSMYLANKIYKLDKSGFSEDRIHRSTRGSNPDLEVGMNFLCHAISSLNVNLYSGTQEVIRTQEPKNIHITFQYISDCIGNDISKEDIALILKKLNFRIQASCDENFFIAQPPSFRSDIKDRQDIVEEVLRLYGVDNITPKKHTIQIESQRSDAYILHKKLDALRQRVLSNGYMECIHYLFDDSEVLEELGFSDIDESKKLVNPITKELNTLRQSLLPHLLSSISKNRRYGYEGIRFFEIGYVYDSDRNPSLKLAMIIDEYLCKPSFPNPKGIKADFFSFARSLSDAIGHFECVNMSLQFVKNKLIHPYHSGNMIKNGNIIGIISKLNPAVAKKYDLDNVFFAEIDMKTLLEQDEDRLAKEFSIYQESKRDLTIIIDDSISFNAIKSALENHLSDEVKSYVKRIFALDVFKQEDNKIALSIRFIFQSHSDTLKEKQIQDAMQEAMDITKDKFNAIVRG